MDDTELYSKLLGITPPWSVTRVVVDMAAERIDVWVAEAPGTKFRCAGCGYRNREHYKTAILFHCGGLDLDPRAPEACAGV